MLNRSGDAELDFDFDAVKEKSKDNPLYYVQYCYARISSVFRHINKDLNKKIETNNFNFEYSEEEIKILSQGMKVYYYFPFLQIEHDLSHQLKQFYH